MLVDHTCGLVFLGTPFEGSAHAKKGLTALNFVSLFSDTKKEDIKDLEKGSLKLAGITEAFTKFLRERDRRQTMQPIDVACFFETHPTILLGKKMGLVVPRESATLRGINAAPIAASHSGMCKFAGDWVNGYVEISGLLARWIKSIGQGVEKESSNDRVSTPVEVSSTEEYPSIVELVIRG